MAEHVGDLKRLSLAQINQSDSEGYLVVENVLSKKEVEALLGAFDRI